MIQLRNPLVVGGITIPSRVFLAPINTGYSRADSPELIAFHCERSMPEIGVNYIGNVAIGNDYRSNSRTLVLDNSEIWRRLATCVLERGSIPGIQLACRYLPYSSSKKWVARDVSTVVSDRKAFVAALPTEKIAEICDLFVRQTLQAWKHGFQVVQLHAAHGYFLSLLSSPTFNSRTDKFAGMGALRYILSALPTSSLNALDVRISMIEGIADSVIEVENAFKIIAELVELHPDVISLSAGIYDVDRNLIYPGKKDGHGYHGAVCSNIASNFPSIVFNMSGNIWDLESLHSSNYPSNMSWSVGRSLIADPMFVKKSFEGRHADIVQCSRFGWCHYFSRGRDQIECGANPSLTKG